MPWAKVWSFFSRRWNQIVIRHFEKMPKNLIFALFWPPFTPYLKNRNFFGLETWHTYEVSYYLSSLGDGTKSSSYILRKCRKSHFWPPFDPISRKQKVAWSWNLAHILSIILSFLSGRWNKIPILHFEKMPKKLIFALFWPPSTPYLKNRNFFGLETWHTYEGSYYLSSLGYGTKSSI